MLGPHSNPNQTRWYPSQHWKFLEESEKTGRGYLLSVSQHAAQYTLLNLYLRPLGQARWQFAAPLNFLQMTRGNPALR